MSVLNKDEILSVLDKAASRFEFPMLDSGYVYPVDVRLSAYSDTTNWALIIEHMGVNNRTFCFGNDVYGFGNCLLRTRTERDFVSSQAFETWRDARRFHDSVTIYPVDDGPSGTLVADEFDLQINDASTDCKIRDSIVSIPRDLSFYSERGIDLEQPPHIKLHELMRALAPEYREMLVATEKELHQIVPEELPLLIRLDEWTHPNLAEGVKPSDLTTFEIIADLIAHADAGLYQMSFSPPNTHWSHWPDGGTL